MGPLDDWHDWWRLANAILCGIGMYILLARYTKNSWSWSSRTTDFWFAMMAWTTTGEVSSIEGILKNSPLGARVLCVSLAVLVTLKAIRKRGFWDENTARNYDVFRADDSRDV